MVIALGIGVYLIATTVLIAKDGISYINYAKGLGIDLFKVMRDSSGYAPRLYTPGYPFLILMTHNLVSLFGDGSTVPSWICSAQAATLLCRILALIPLYFIGKEFVGGKLSFWAILILMMLPYPAEFGSDVLREWPYVFFLAFGFWAILWGAQKRSWWIFGLAGLSSGFGYMIRPVCAQLIVYGLVWLGYCFLRPAKTIARHKAILALALLIGGFLIPVGPYTKARGVVLPLKVRGLITSFPFDAQSYKSNQRNPCPDDQLPTEYVAGYSNVFFDALYNIYKDIGENLIWIFTLPWLIGAFHYFRHPSAKKGKFLMSLFITVNIVFLFLRSTNFDKAMSKRYVLPLIALTMFYVSTGLELLSRKILNSGRDNRTSNSQKPTLFYALVVIGLCICTPDLLRPIRVEKKGYRLAAEWLKENSAKEDVIVVPDKRISFYADRKGIEKLEKSAKYVVKKLKNGEGTPAGMTEVWSSYLNNKKKNKVVIYQRK